MWLNAMHLDQTAQRHVLPLYPSYTRKELLGEFTVEEMEEANGTVKPAQRLKLLLAGRQPKSALAVMQPSRRERIGPLYSALLAADSQRRKLLSLGGTLVSVACFKAAGSLNDFPG